MQAALRPRPSAFSLVMATGIVAVAAHQQQLAAVEHAMFAVAALSWVVLTCAYGARLACDRGALAAEMRDHAIAPGFLTAVAASSVLAGNLLLEQWPLAWPIALAIWAGTLWLLLTYGVLVSLTTSARKPSLEEGLNGGWLLAVVATQSIAVIGALVSPEAEQPARLALNFGALCMWLLGGALYTWIISLIFYRYLFFRFEARDLTPPYWINMGAMAISTLAGSLLVSNTPDAPWLASLQPFIEGFTLLYWATATWWLPMLVALSVWRYAVRRVDKVADAFDWSMVFPLGMYSAATHQMQNALRLPFLGAIDSAFCCIAIAAWLLTAAAKLRSALSRS